MKKLIPGFIKIIVFLFLPFVVGLVYQWIVRNDLYWMDLWVDGLFCFGGMLLALFVFSHWWQDLILAAGGLIWCFLSPSLSVLSTGYFPNLFPRAMVAFFLALAIAKVVYGPNGEIRVKKPSENEYGFLTVYFWDLVKAVVILLLPLIVEAVLLRSTVDVTLWVEGILCFGGFLLAVMIPSRWSTDLVIAGGGLIWVFLQMMRIFDNYHSFSMLFPQALTAIFLAFAVAKLFRVPEKQE